MKVKAVQFLSEAGSSHANPVGKVASKNGHKMIRSGERQAVETTSIASCGKKPLLDIDAKGEGMEQIKDKLALGGKQREAEALKETLDGRKASLIGFVFNP